MRRELLRDSLEKKEMKVMNRVRFSTIILVLLLSAGILFTGIYAIPPSHEWIPPAPPPSYFPDQQYDPPTYGREYSIVGNTPIGQEFIPEGEILIAVAVEIGGEGDATIRMNLRNGSIAGHVIYTEIRSVNSDERGWLLFTIVPGIRLNPGETYVIELQMEDGNRTWRANQQPILVNPFHRGRAIIKGSIDENEDLHIITFVQRAVTVEEYVYTGAPAVNVVTKTIISPTTIIKTTTKKIEISRTTTTTLVSVKTETTTETRISKELVKEYVPVTIYIMLIVLLVVILVIAIILKIEEHRRKPR